jgi:endonuclease G
MKSKFLFSIYIILALSAVQNTFSQYSEIHCKHFLYGYPKGVPPTNDLIIRDIYALSSNDSTKFADWVCYRLDSATISGPSNKERNWEPDPWLEEDETLEPKDYEGAPKALSIDRGHQAPLANFKGTPYAFETNYLSNITPQKSALNQGVWKDLEDKERELTLKYGLVYVLTGPLYEKDIGIMPKADEPHIIPSGYWKIIAIPFEKDIKQMDKVEIFSFIFDQNTPRKGDLINFLVSVDEVEKRTKLFLFTDLDDKTQNKLEARPNDHFHNYFK